MSLGHNPKIVKDGLVLALDAANKKSSLRAIEALIVEGGGAGGGAGGGVERGGGGDPSRLAEWKARAGIRPGRATQKGRVACEAKRAL